MPAGSTRAGPTETIRVVHAIGPWLPRTASWLHTQVTRLPAEISSSVVCRTTENLDQFAVPGLLTECGASRSLQVGHRLLRKLGFDRFSPFLAGHLDRIGAQVLHSHFGFFAWEHLPAARRAGVPHCVTFYGMDVSALPQRRPVWRDRYAELFSEVAFVLCEGPYMAQSIRELGCAPEKVKVHHLGIDLVNWPFRPRRWDGREPLRVLIAATFREKKGIPYALEALGVLRREVPMTITVIGDASADADSRKEKRRILEVIQRYGLGPHVRLLGFQPYAVLRETAYAHHLFVSPSVKAADGDTEGGAPVCLIEMAASGMPVVSTLHCDIPEVIRNGETGLLAPERDVEGLVAHLRDLIGRPEGWEEMLQRGRTHIEAEYDAEVQGRRLADIYRGSY